MEDENFNIELEEEEKVARVSDMEIGQSSGEDDSELGELDEDELEDIDEMRRQYF